LEGAQRANDGEGRSSGNGRNSRAAARLDWMSLAQPWFSRSENLRHQGHQHDGNDRQRPQPIDPGPVVVSSAGWGRGRACFDRLSMRENFSAIGARAMKNFLILSLSKDARCLCSRHVQFATVASLRRRFSVRRHIGLQSSCVLPMFGGDLELRAFPRSTRREQCPRAMADRLSLRPRGCGRERASAKGSIRTGRSC